MAQRVFHQRLTLGFKCGLALFTMLVVYLFWIKQAIFGLLVVIIIVGMIERVLHTTYTFACVKPIDRDEKMEFLLIDKGRFSRSQSVPLRDVVQCKVMHTNFGLSHYLLIEYGAHHLVAVQPKDEQAFVEELTKRQQAEAASSASQNT